MIRLIDALRKPVTVAAVLVLFSCSTEDKKGPVDSYSWLLGTWRSETDHGHFYEVWERASGYVFEGHGFEIVAGDTTFGESLRFEARNDTLFYVADVPDNPKPVSFRLVTSEPNALVFENAAHDFPQRIMYRLRDDGKLYVHAETMDGESTVRFNFEPVATAAEDGGR